MNWRYCAGGRYRRWFLAEPLFSVLAVLRAERLFSALRAGVLSFASPKESSQRKGDPRVGARCAGPLRYSKSAGAAELGPAGLKQSSPSFRRFLRCSAPFMGTRKASRNDGSAQEKRTSVFSGQTLEKTKNHFYRFRRDVFPGPHVERRATQVLAEKARGLFEGRSPEFRSARQCRVAQGSRRSRPRSLGSPSIWLLFLGEARKSTPARKAEHSRQTNTAFSVAENKALNGLCPRKHGKQFPIEKNIYLIPLQ